MNNFLGDIAMEMEGQNKAQKAVCGAFRSKENKHCVWSDKCVTSIFARVYANCVLCPLHLLSADPLVLEVSMKYLSIFKGWHWLNCVCDSAFSDSCLARTLLPQTYGKTTDQMLIKKGADIEGAVVLQQNDSAGKSM